VATIGLPKSNGPLQGVPEVGPLATGGLKGAATALAMASPPCQIDCAKVSDAELVTTGGAGHLALLLSLPTELAKEFLLVEEAVVAMAETEEFAVSTEEAAPPAAAPAMASGFDPSMSTSRTPLMRLFTWALVKTASLLPPALSFPLVALGFISSIV